MKPEQPRPRQLRHDLRNALHAINMAHTTLHQKFPRQYSLLKPQLSSIMAVHDFIAQRRRDIFQETDHRERQKTMEAFVAEHKLEIQKLVRETDETNLDDALEDFYRKKGNTPETERFTPSSEQLREFQFEVYDKSLELIQHVRQLLKSTKIRKNEVKTILETLHGSAQKIKDIALASDPGGEKVFDLNEVTANVAVPRMSLKTKKVVQVVATNNGLPAPVLGEKSMVKNMLHNLLDNAVKHSSKKRKPNVSIHLEVRPDEKKAVVHVSDNGPGMPRDKIELLRTHAGSEIGISPGEGEGLGIIKESADKHHASINIQSTRKGTTFSISFPLHSK